MDHPGFSIVHIQSPCTTYNDTFEILKGNPKKGIQPLLWNIAQEHDPSNANSAYNLIHSGGWPVGIIYQNTERPSLDQQAEEIHKKVGAKTAQQLLDRYNL